MTTYVLDVDESSRQGRALQAYLTELADGQTVRLVPLEEHERAEEEALTEGIRQSESSALLNYEDSKAEFARLRNRLIP
jgi:hypothetical protein